MHTERYTEPLKPQLSVRESKRIEDRMQEMIWYVSRKYLPDLQDGILTLTSTHTTERIMSMRIHQGGHLTHDLISASEDNTRSMQSFPSRSLSSQFDGYLSPSILTRGGAIRAPQRIFSLGMQISCKWAEALLLALAVYVRDLDASTVRDILRAQEEGNEHYDELYNKFLAVP